METTIITNNCKLKLVSQEGEISKSAAHVLGCSVTEMLGKLVGVDGKFKDAEWQAKFEAWKQTPEGMRYA